MNRKALIERWKTPEGRSLEEEAITWIVGLGSFTPRGFGVHDGRRDLRGLTLPPPERLGQVTAGGVDGIVIGGFVELRGIRWEGVDLSHARLASLRFFNSVIEDCRFDAASCGDWRLWASDVRDSSFVACDLRDSAMGTWQHGLGNAWRRVSFDRADLRGALILGCLLDDCSFQDARLRDVQFQQVTMRDCVFAGVLKDVLFDCRDLPGKPEADAMKNIDFNGAIFEDVEFRGCRFEAVSMPHMAGIHVIPSYPRVARRVLELLADNSSVEARMLVAELQVALKMPGREDSVGVFNRRDYLTAGGEPLADLAETLLMEAAAETAP